MIYQITTLNKECERLNRYVQIVLKIVSVWFSYLSRVGLLPQMDLAVDGKCEFYRVIRGDLDRIAGHRNTKF